MLLRSLLDGPTVEACRSDADRRLADAGGAASILAVPVLADGSIRDDFLGPLARDGRLTDLAAELLGADVACFGCTYLVKAAGVGPAALWHQDGRPWSDRLGVTRAVTLWAALDDVHAGNGALEMVPGSHRFPAQPLVAVPGEEGGLFGTGLDPAWMETSGVAALATGVLEMDAGDVSAHHPALVHRSGANRSAAPRRALVLRYRPA